MSNGNDTITTSDRIALTNDIHEIGKGLSNVSLLVSRLDVAVEKLSDVGQSMAKHALLLEKRVESNEKLTEQIRESNEISRREYREELEKLKLDVVAREKNTLEVVEQLRESSDERLKVVERWMWLIMGAGVVLGYLLNLFVK